MKTTKMLANVFSRFQMHQKDLKGAKEVYSIPEEIHKFYLFQSEISNIELLPRKRKI